MNHTETAAYRAGWEAADRSVSVEDIAQRAAEWAGANPLNPYYHRQTHSLIAATSAALYVQGWMDCCEEEAITEMAGNI